jgi:hypothetical protein
MLIVVLVLQTGYCVLYVYGTKRFLETNAIEVGSIGSTRRLSQVIAFQARQLELSCSFPRLASGNASVIQKRLSDSAKSFSALIASAQDDVSLFNDESIPVWTAPAINASFTTTTGAAYSSMVDTITLFNLYSSHVTQLATFNVSSLDCPRHATSLLYTRQFTTHAFSFIPSWQFIMSNGISNVIDSIWKVLDITMLTHLKRSARDLSYFFALVGCILVLPLLTIVFLVIPYYKTLARERRAVLHMFFKLPSDILTDMAATTKSALHHFLDASPQKVPRGDSSRIKFNSSFLSFTSSGGATSLDELFQESSQVNMLSPAQMVSEIHKRRPSWVKLSLIFCASVILLLSFVCTSTYLMYYASQKTQDAAIKVNYAGSRRSYTYRLLVLAQEWIRRDRVIWPDPGVLRDMYVKNVQDAYRVHQGVKYGDTLLSLRASVNTYGPQDTLLRSRQCVDGNDTSCMSLEEMYTMFLQKATQLISENETTLTFDSEVYKTINSMQSGTFSRYLDMSKQYYIDEVLVSISSNALMQRVIFSLSFLVTGLVLFSLWRMKRGIKLHIDGTRQLLHMLPYECTTRTKAIQVYLRRGKVLMDAELSKAETQTPSIIFSTFKGSANFLSRLSQRDLTFSQHSSKQTTATGKERSFLGFKKNIVDFKLSQSADSFVQDYSQISLSVPEVVEEDFPPGRSLDAELAHQFTAKRLDSSSKLAY